MKTFACHCGNVVYFENTLCLACGRRVAFLPDRLTVAALEAQSDGGYRALLPDPGPYAYRPCRNDTDYHVCNWMVRADEGNAFCVSCRLNRVIPDLSSFQNHTLWFRIEAAKRRLLYTVLQLRLPFVGRDRDACGGLGFQFLADPEQSLEFSDEAGPRDRILTGHGNGLITINLAEADHIARELMRAQMNEGYRTLLGHFRHESGHYFWDRMVRDGAWLDGFRALFGDERLDYAAALGRYYEQGPPADWPRQYISAYAASHPWEDWAETWAHYLHMTDTLETAEDYGFAILGERLQSPASRQLSLDGLEADARGEAGVERLLADWGRLTTAMNAINRSMGLEDAYPFTLGELPARKIAFVHALLQCAREPE